MSQLLLQISFLKNDVVPDVVTVVVVPDVVEEGDDVRVVNGQNVEYPTQQNLSIISVSELSQTDE